MSALQATPPASPLDAQNLQLIQSIRDDLERDVPARVIWDYGYNIKAQTIVVIKKSDSLLDKIIFIFNWIIGRIDCSATRFFKLTQNLENRVIRERESKIANLGLEFEQLRATTKEKTKRMASQTKETRKELQAAERELAHLQEEQNTIKNQISIENKTTSDLRRDIQALQNQKMEIESVLAQLVREEQGIEARKQELERRHNELGIREEEFQQKKMMLEQEGKTLPEYYDQLEKKNSQLAGQVSQLEKINSQLVSQKKRKQEEIKNVQGAICRLVGGLLFRYPIERGQILNGVIASMNTLYKSTS